MGIEGRDFLINGPTIAMVRFGDHISGGIVAPQTILNVPMPGPPDDDVEDDGPDFDEDDETEWEEVPNVNEDDIQFSSAAPILDAIPSLYELGLSSEQISINFVSYKKELYADDFGPHVPPEVANHLGEAQIQMKLIHYDQAILLACVGESMGRDGGRTNRDPPEGVLPGAGVTLGRGKPLFASGNHYVSLSLVSQDPDFPWHFPTCYLTDRPFIYPLGTEKSIVVLNWRAIPYVPLFNRRDSEYGTATSGDRLSGSIREIASSGAVLWNRNIANITDPDYLNQIIGVTPRVD